MLTYLAPSSIDLTWVVKTLSKLGQMQCSIMHINRAMLIPLTTRLDIVIDLVVNDDHSLAIRGTNVSASSLRQFPSSANHERYSASAKTSTSGSSCISLYRPFSGTLCSYLRWASSSARVGNPLSHTRMTSVENSRQCQRLSVGSRKEDC